VADGRLELDERMSAVVGIDRTRFTGLAEISVVAHGTLVAVTNDIGRRGTGIPA
jgi:hypothetical protein